MYSFSIKKYYWGAIFFGLLFGVMSVFYLSIQITRAQPLATEADFDPAIVYGEWLGQDPWAPCGQWIDVNRLNIEEKNQAVKCVAKRDAALKHRRDYYLDPNYGWHKTAACLEKCTRDCEAAEAARGLSADCTNGYIKRPNEIEKIMLDCKRVCQDVGAAEEASMESPIQVLQTCCEALKDRVPSGPEPADCFDGVRNGNEQGIDCGGSCGVACPSDISVSLSPQEVSMVADGQTKMEFTVSLIQDGRPLAGEKIEFRLNDERNTVPDDKEGHVTQTSSVTDKNGQIKFVYQTSEQDRDFATSTLLLQAVHPKGNPVARITLTPGLNLWCGNWDCQTGENHDNCPEDCPRAITKEQAWDYIVQKYQALPLNPYARQGVWCASCPTNNRVLKAIAYEEINIFNNQELADYTKHLKDQYEPWVCGSHQTRVINMLDGLRLSSDATEREIIAKYFDYGPIEVMAPYVLNPLAGHLAAVVYDKGGFWPDNGRVLDIWLRNAHDIYPIEDWEFEVHGQARGFQCDTAAFYPVCGAGYQQVLRSEYELTAQEKAYYDNLPSEVKAKVNTSIRDRARNDVQDAKLKYLIQKMMAYDVKDKVRVLVMCPLNVLLTNKATGLSVGYDAKGNFVSQDPEIYPEIREYANGESIAYFVVPKDQEYEISAVGTGQGSVTVLTSRPNDQGEFEVYKYEGGEVVNGSILTLSVSGTDAPAELSVDGRAIVPVLADKGITRDGVDLIMQTASGLYPNYQSNQLMSNEYPPLYFEPTFDAWSFFGLMAALAFFALAVFLFLYFIKKDKKSLAVSLLVGSMLLGFIGLGMVAVRYAGHQTEKGSDLRTVPPRSDEASPATPVVRQVDDMAAVSSSSNHYINQKYGFQLSFTPAWQNYLVEELPVDDVYSQAVINFYLPTAEDSEYSDKPGYMKMFVMSVYDQSSWQAYRQECESMDLCWEEEAGRNQEYVFGWSHFNGIQPSDIPEQAVWDMQTIIKTFKSTSVSQATSAVDWTAGTDVKTYHSCAYNYSLAYPARWTTVTADLNSPDAKFHGDNIALSVTSHASGKMTLDDFYRQQASRTPGTITSSRDQERNGKRLIADQYQNPEAVYVYWEDQDSFLELAVTGRQVNDFIVNTDFFSYFNTNASNPDLCGN